MIEAVIILAIIYIVAKDECDQILFHKPLCFFPKWKWYAENNWRTKSWWLKYPLSMFCDGWHFWDSFRNAIVGFYLAVILTFQYGIITPYNWHYVAITVGYYVILGTYHNWRSGSIFGERMVDK